MSAYIVSYETMDRVVSYIAKREQINPESRKIKNLIKKLWDLNVFSLSERYGEKEKEAYKGYINSYSFNYRDLNENSNKEVMKFIKSLSNYLYQSCEGRAEKTKLFKKISKYADELAWRFVYNSEEWKKEAWE